MRANALGNCPTTLRDGTSLRHLPAWTPATPTLGPLVTWPYGPLQGAVEGKHPCANDVCMEIDQNTDGVRASTGAQ
ncbi:hypothetical protein OG21DRAFT_1028572 [Imleria badia]|nr:hypothetical protein OG21DRAFT_1028572 [Imleria badia]